MCLVYVMSRSHLELTHASLVHLHMNPYTWDVVPREWIHILYWQRPQWSTSGLVQGGYIRVTPTWELFLLLEIRLRTWELNGRERSVTTISMVCLLVDLGWIINVPLWWCFWYPPIVLWSPQGIHSCGDWWKVMRWSREFVFLPLVYASHSQHLLPPLPSFTQHHSKNLTKLRLPPDLGWISIRVEHIDFKGSNPCCL